MTGTRATPLMPVPMLQQPSSFVLPNRIPDYGRFAEPASSMVSVLSAGELVSKTTPARKSQVTSLKHIAVADACSAVASAASVIAAARAAIPARARASAPLCATASQYSAPVHNHPIYHSVPTQMAVATSHVPVTLAPPSTYEHPPISSNLSPAISAALAEHDRSTARARQVSEALLSEGERAMQPNGERTPPAGRVLMPFVPAA
jgi:hypothetical protein